MKYFILYVTGRFGYTNEHYLKGKTMSHMEERIARYSNGLLATSKKDIVTETASFGYLKEIILDDFPQLSKKDFAVINEMDSYDVSDFESNDLSEFY